MNICVFSPTASWLVGGGENYSLNQAGALADNGAQVHLVVLKTTRKTEAFKYFLATHPNVKVHEIVSRLDLAFNITDWTDHYNIHQLYFALMRPLGKIIKNEGFDSVIIHYAPGILAVPSDCHSLLLLHGVPSGPNGLDEIAFNMADIRLAVSRSVADGWKKLYPIKEPIPVIYNAVDPNRFQSIDCPLDIDIFSIGRLIKIKGIQTLIEAVDKLRSEKDVNLKKVVIAGDGPFRLDLEKMVNRLGLNDVIYFVGLIPEKELSKYYNRSRICVFPSYAKEGVLTTMLEAASCARPIITANCCGMVDFIVNGQNGLLFNPQDSRDLAEKIRRLFNNSVLRENLGQKAREDIIKGWTWPINAERITKFL